MLYYIATKFGFMVNPNSRHCTPDVRFAHPFESMQDADQAGREMFEQFPYAILSNCIGEQR